MRKNGPGQDGTGAGDGEIKPLALGLEAGMSADFVDGDFNRPTMDDPSRDAVRRLLASLPGRAIQNCLAGRGSGPSQRGVGPTRRGADYNPAAVSSAYSFDLTFFSTLFNWVLSSSLASAISLVS